MQKHLAVIGGGASGFFCAINAKLNNPNLKVSLFEKNVHVLQKVKVSGGGRCNVTHRFEKLSDFVDHYPRGRNFLKKAFQLFSPLDTITWFKGHGIQLHTEGDGRVFPVSNSSQTIIDIFLKLCNQLQIDIYTKQDVIDIEKKNTEWTLNFKSGHRIQANAIFIATGGFSKIENYQFIKNLGHSISSPIPSLFTFNAPKHPICGLMGISTQAEVKIQGLKRIEQGPVLITHWGLSGPAVLKLSAFLAKELAACNYQFTCIINWVLKPESNLREQWNTLRDAQKAKLLYDKNPFELPARLWEFLLHESGIDHTMKWSELNAKAQNKLISNLCSFSIPIHGKTTFKEEFVTCGGVSLSKVEAQSMQSKLHKGLYFGGEVLDIDGVTGGFNFQHAWTSGYLAGISIAKELI